MPKFLKKYRGYSDKKLINYDVIVYLSNGFNMGDGMYLDKYTVIYFSTDFFVVMHILFKRNFN